ncbi:NADPH-dependent 7-cyano-7-deazaguanine reductase [Streptomyces sp. NPDC056656]|uniref:preQ(1) synthase n=1 Tax=Streptomyces sp. NPDC056656 TaxID=3345895 RepID=UPI00369F36F0
MTQTTTYLGEHLGRPLTADELATPAAIIAAPDHLTDVTFTTSELSANCPVTRQPDLYTATISYRPTAGKCVESKALKHYLWSFRDQNIYAEELASRIAGDLHQALHAPIAVSLTQQVRGGLTLTVTANAAAPEEPQHG